MAKSPVPFEVDERNNPICVSLFESYLGKFVLEHTDLYKNYYLQLLTELESFIQALPDQGRVAREIYMMFSMVQEHYKGFGNFKELTDPKNFNISACDFFIKHVCDYFVTRNINSPKQAHQELKSPIPNHVKLSFYAVTEGRGSPTNSHRDQRLFHESNRGVTARAGSPVIEPCTNFAKNLRRYWCPVISGASGSTESLFTRIFSITSLNKEQQQLLIFVQACNMVANGHHSLFEAMFVAHTLGFEIEPKETVKEFYLQCVPSVFKENEAFQAFMELDTIIALQLDTYYPDVCCDLDENPEPPLLRGLTPSIPSVALSSRSP